MGERGLGWDRKTPQEKGRRSGPWAAELGGLLITQGLAHIPELGFYLSSNERLSGALSKGVPGSDSNLEELF